MPTPTVSIAIDTPQPRIIGDRLAQTVSGRNWDLPASSAGAYLEFVAFTGMLLPLPASAAWLTTTGGQYARLRKSQLSIAGNSAWTEYERSYPGNWYVHSLDDNAIVQTNESFERNRPMFLSFMNYNVGNESFVVMECGWGEGTGSEVSLRIWSDGNTEIWKNLEKVGSAKFNERVSYPSGFGPQQFDDGSPGKILANETIDLMLIPGRRRELLVLSNQGGGFNFLFEDIDPEEDDPTITGPGPFWFHVPQGQATAQLAVLHFEDEGILLSPTFQLREAPGAGEIHTELVSYDLPGYGTQTVEVSLREANGVTLFVPDGNLRDCRIRVDMTGDGDSTPFVYVASSAFEALTAQLDNAFTFLDKQEGERGWWMSCELDVPDDPEGVSFRVNLSDPAGVEARGAYDLRGTGNRDLEAAIDGIQFFIGRTLDPEYEAGPNEQAEAMLLEARDRSVIQERYLIEDPEALDGFNFSFAIAYLAKLPGFTDADMDIGAIDYALPSIDQNSDGQFALLPGVGDTPTMWIRKLWEEFAKKCVRGWVPTAGGVLYRFKTPAQLGDESQATLYVSDSSAIADGRPPGEYKSWIREWKPRTLQPEANDIYVVGRDPQTRRPLRSHYRDTASIDPTVLPIDRPDNWIGEIRKFGWVDPSLTTQADCDWALGNFIETLTVRRRVAGFKSQFLIRPDGAPVWKGDVITVKGTRPNALGVTLDGKWRIRTLSALFDLEHANADDITALDRIWRETTYVAEKEPEFL